MFVFIVFVSTDIKLIEIYCCTHWSFSRICKNSYAREQLIGRVNTENENFIPNDLISTEDCVEYPFEIRTRG